MSKIDTKNSNSNLDYIADELFNELTSELAGSIQGGGLIVYDHKNGKTWLGTFSIGKSTLSQRADNDISSVRITDDQVWEFYEDPKYNYYGAAIWAESVRLRPGLHNLANYNFDQKVSSFKRIL